jgi:hypothetical protein
VESKTLNTNDENSAVAKTFPNEFEAERAKGILKENGIESFVQRDDAGGMEPPLQLTEGVKLIVLEDDLQKAKEILDAYNDYTPKEGD